MLREPKQVQQEKKPEKQPSGRFQIRKVEERIAPACTFNPNAGKYVGCGSNAGGGYK
jgi:hypothetical protein